MQFRDKLFLAVGVVLVLGGAVGTFMWEPQIGIVALLALGLLILVLVLLQRRQLARVQQRTLTLLKMQQRSEVSPNAVKVPSFQDLAVSTGKVQEDLAISTTKIIGLLQAQHVALELLNEKLEQAVRNDGGPRY
jgi:ketopantoate reductase